MKTISILKFLKYFFLRYSYLIGEEFSKKYDPKTEKIKEQVNILLLLKTLVFVSSHNLKI